MASGLTTTMSAPASAAATQSTLFGKVGVECFIACYQLVFGEGEVSGVMAPLGDPTRTAALELAFKGVFDRYATELQAEYSKEPEGPRRNNRSFFMLMAAKQNPGANSKAISDMWNNLPEEEKEKWKVLADQDNVSRGYHPSKSAKKVSRKAAGGHNTFVAKQAMVGLLNWCHTQIRNGHAPHEVIPRLMLELNQMPDGTNRLVNDLSAERFNHIGMGSYWTTAVPGQPYNLSAILEPIFWNMFLSKEIPENLTESYTTFYPEHIRALPVMTDSLSNLSSHTVDINIPDIQALTDQRLEYLTVTVLKSICKNHHIKVASGDRRDNLISHIQKLRDGHPSDVGTAAAGGGGGSSGLVVPSLGGASFSLSTAAPTAAPTSAAPMYGAAPTTGVSAPMSYSATPSVGVSAPFSAAPPVGVSAPMTFTTGTVPSYPGAPVGVPSAAPTGTNPHDQVMAAAATGTRVKATLFNRAKADGQRAYLAAQGHPLEGKTKAEMQAYAVDNGLVD